CNAANAANIGQKRDFGQPAAPDMAIFNDQTRQRLTLAGRAADSCRQSCGSLQGLRKDRPLGSGRPATEPLPCLALPPSAVGCATVAEKLRPGAQPDGCRSFATTNRAATPS